MVALSTSGNPVKLLAGKKEMFSKNGNTVMLLLGRIVLLLSGSIVLLLSDAIVTFPSATMGIIGPNPNGTRSSEVALGLPDLKSYRVTLVPGGSGSM
jgi:hypothetical protein